MTQCVGLMILGLLLMIWHPLSAAAVASASLNELSSRGPGLSLLLLVRLIVTAMGVASAIALFRRRSHAVALAMAALVGSAVVDLLVYATPYVPNNRLPGTTQYYVAWTLIYHGGWLIYLTRSACVRRAFL
jgi:hypothetical protein